MCFAETTKKSTWKGTLRNYVEYKFAFVWNQSLPQCCFAFKKNLVRGKTFESISTMYFLEKSNVYSSELFIESI